MSKSILNYYVESGTVEKCVAQIAETIHEGKKSARWLACLNPHSYAVARKETDFAKALHSADWLVPDGVGILIGGHILGEPLEERITGFDVFEGVMQELDRVGGSVFFLGGTPKTLRLIEKKLPSDFPSVQCVGTYSPPFKDSFSQTELEEMISVVTAARPDVLWVGMTAPKQERWIAQNRERLPVDFAGAIGAVFDFYTGQVKRSHPVFCRLGLEWLPRLAQQPRRLWRRMFISAPIFLLDIVCARVRKARNLGPLQ